MGAHGTGCSIPPVEEQVVSMRLVTPGMGVVQLSSQDHDQKPFSLAKVGLGCMGVVTELTLRCVPCHELDEEVVVMTRQQVRKGHYQRLLSNRHIKYTQPMNHQ